MNEKPYLLSAVRADLESLAGPMCRATWVKMKAAAGIDGFARRCDEQQWLRLCAYVAIRRQSATTYISAWKLDRFIAQHGNNPADFLPGFVSTSRNTALPEMAGGYELQRIIKATYNLDLPYSTIDRYCRVLFGEGLRVKAVYSRQQVEAIVKRRGEILAAQKRRQVEAGQRLVEFNRLRTA